MKREEQLALKKAEHEGKVYPSNRFGDIKILEYKNNKQVVIMFLNTGFITEESMGVIRSGHIRDNSLPTTCGFGYIDIEGVSIGRKATKEYQLWNNMINRCYNENLRHKIQHIKTVLLQKVGDTYLTSKSGVINRSDLITMVGTWIRIYCLKSAKYIQNTPVCLSLLR